jgi:hypothetical protein
MRILLLTSLLVIQTFTIASQKPLNYWPFNQSLSELAARNCVDVIDLYDLNDKIKIFSTYDLPYTIVLGDTCFVRIHAPRDLKPLFPDALLSFRIVSDSSHYEIGLEIDESGAANNAFLTQVVCDQNADSIGFIAIWNYLQNGNPIYFEKYVLCWQKASVDSNLIWLNGLLQYWGVLLQVSSTKLLPYRDIPLVKYGFK